MAVLGGSRWENPLIPGFVSAVKLLIGGGYPTIYLQQTSAAILATGCHGATTVLGWLGGVAGDKQGQIIM